MTKFTFKKRGRRLLALRSSLLVSALMFSSLSFAQTATTTVGTGTGTTTNLPIYGLYGYTYSQEIYLASDMNPIMAGQQSYITKLRFFNVTGSLTNANAWTVYMGNTAQANFATTTSWVPAASMTQVFSGSLTAPTANTWLEITLTTPFLWDGVSNIVVGVDENTSGFSGITWRSHTTGANRSMYYYSDGTNPDPTAPPTASSRFSSVPQAQFVHVPVNACAGTPAHTTAISSSSTVCENATVNLSLNGTEFTTGLSFQWQYDDGSGYQNFVGATSPTFTTPALTTSISVRAQITCANSSMTDISDAVAITVNPNPVVSVDVPDAAYCAGAPITVSALGANSYAWSPATGLDNTNTGIVNASPSTTTLYTVTGTSIFGCIGTATSKITPLNQAVRAATFHLVLVVLQVLLLQLMLLLLLRLLTVETHGNTVSLMPMVLYSKIMVQAIRIHLFLLLTAFTPFITR